MVCVQHLICLLGEVLWLCSMGGDPGTNPRLIRKTASLRLPGNAAVSFRMTQGGLGCSAQTTAPDPDQQKVGSL